MKVLDFNNYHFIGIGGIGVSAIAKMLFLKGKKVSGSDNSRSEITDDLKKLGVKIYIGQKAENLKKQAEIVVYSVAINENNPELKEAKNRKIICISYPQFLGELSKNMFTIAISGTHGKTTTTAMVGHILKKAGFDPTIIVGSKMIGGDGQYSNFHAGKSKYLVVEACEYKRSFLNLNPKILVITNIEADHLDYYKDLNDIKSAFKEMEKKVPEDGFIIKEKDYKKIKKDFDLLVPGKHNILNAQAAITAAEKLGVPQKKSKEYLKDFKGTWRRLEYKGEKNGEVFYDDYAHHPTEIKASFLALKEKYQNRKIICVFEPHQQSRTKKFFKDFVSALKIADQVFIAPIFITREIDDGKTTNKILTHAVNKFTPALAVKNIEELKNNLAKIKKEESLCAVFMGAGDIYKWTKKIINN